MTDDECKCPKCGAEMLLYTKPNGNYLAYTKCDFTEEAYMESIRK